MPELPEIVAFIVQYKGQFEDDVIRERLKADGATPEQIEEGFKSVTLRAQVEAEQISGSIKTAIVVALLGLAGVIAALKYAPGVGSDSAVPKLSMQAGEVDDPKLSSPGPRLPSR